MSDHASSPRREQPARQSERSEAERVDRFVEILMAATVASGGAEAHALSGEKPHENGAYEKRVRSAASKATARRLLANS